MNGASIAVIALSGELEIGRKAEIRRALQLARAPRSALIDCSEVTYADSTALAELMRFHAEADTRGERRDPDRQQAVRKTPTVRRPGRRFRRFRIARCGAQLPWGATRTVIGASELRIVHRAEPTAPRQLRHALRAFLDVFGIEGDFLDDVLLAVGEVLANSVEHAYEENAKSTIELLARAGKNGTLAIDVYDEGKFIERERLPNRGFGLRIVRAIARTVTIETERGTRVQMVFDAGRLQSN